MYSHRAEPRICVAGTLRFASDEEPPTLVKRALDENLNRKDIKKAVTRWRPDYSRV